MQPPVFSQYTYTPNTTSYYQPNINYTSYPTYSGYQYEGYQNAKIGQIEGQSHIQYLPYQRKVIEYQEVEEIQYVPYEVKYIDYQQRKRIEKVPVQKTYTDYYTVQHITQYVPQVVPQTHIQYIPVEKTQNRLHYYPVERQYILNQNDIRHTTSIPNYNKNNHNINVHQGYQTTTVPQFHSKTTYHNLPSYPVYDHNLHKIVENTKQTESIFLRPPVIKQDYSPFVHKEQIKR